MHGIQALLEEPACRLMPEIMKGKLHQKGGIRFGAFFFALLLIGSSRTGESSNISLCDRIWDHSPNLPFKPPRTSLGLAGSGLEFNRFEAGDFTEAQKKRIGSYETGQEILFGKAYRLMGVKVGEVGKVASVDKEDGTVRLKMEDGRNVTMTPRKLSGKDHEIGQRETIELSLGDRIRITGNSLRLDGVTNGMRGEVVDVSGSRIMIRFDSGLEYGILVGKTPLEIDHGYAQTGHSAQGLGAGTVILDLPSGSQTLNRRSFYTNLTRTKGAVIAYTDDRERLTGAVTREKDKTMAHDVEIAQKDGRGTRSKAREIGPELEI